MKSSWWKPVPIIAPELQQFARNVNTSWQAWLILLLALIATGFAACHAKRDIDSQLQRQFALASKEMQLRIESRLHTFKQVLLGGAAIFDASTAVDRDEWRAFARRLEIDKYLTGMHAIGFSLLVPPAQLSQHIADIRQQGFPQYSIHPAGERDLYSAIVFIEPFADNNLRAFGYDMYAEPVRRAAMNDARDRNTVTLSAKVRLVQYAEHTAQVSSLMYVPVYRKNMPHETVEQRREAIYGWVYSAVNLNQMFGDIMQNWQDPLKQHVNVSIYEGNGVDGDSLLYSSSLDKPQNRYNSLTRQLDFNGRIWTLQFSQQHTGAVKTDYGKVWITLAGGASSSLLLFLLTLSYLNTKRNAALIADNLTAELRHQKFALDQHAIVCIISNEGKIEYVNQRLCNISGYTEQELIGRNYRQLDSGLHQDRFFSALYQTIAAGKVWTGEICKRSASGELYWVMTTITPYMNAHGKPVRYIAIGTDITAQRKSQEQLKLLETCVSRLNDIVLITEAEPFSEPGPRTIFVNDAFERRTGYSREEIIGISPRLLQGPNTQRDELDRIRVALESWQPVRAELINYTKSGEEFWLELDIVPVADETGWFTHWVAVERDITERKQAELKIQQLVFYDQLTNLPNRRFLMDRLHQALATSDRNSRYGALLFLDLDQFKTLNDTKGHDIGDKLLLAVAQRLLACVRDGDTVARFGGDEFVVVLENLSGQADEAAAQAELVAEKIRGALNLPYQLDEHTHYSTPSVGIVMFQGKRTKLDELIKHADTAMYQAKTAGRNTIRFYDRSMQAKLEERAALENDLRLALEKKQFCLHYQVQVDAAGRPFGAEVLIRWQHPVRGLVSPAQFVPLAEETGLILAIGSWVLRAACDQLAAWQKDPALATLAIAVNVSSRQFHQADFAKQLEQLLLQTGAPAQLLKLELTESIVLEDVEDTIAKMQALRKLGVGFSLDDFGTGYSSLQYLRRLPLDQIKIDQSFVRDIHNDPNDAIIVQTIIAMARALGLDMIAEGVETQAELTLLKQYQCQAFQGFLFGRPMPIEAFEQASRPQLASDSGS